MPRPARAFTPESFELEGRLLQTSGPAPTPLNPMSVQFDSPTSVIPWVGPNQPTQLVPKQASEVTVTLSRKDTAGSLQVEVTTNPLAPDAMDQTVTFADGQSQATRTIPILAGAPNPGVVDVDLYAYPIHPPTPAPGSSSIPVMPLAMLDLKIVASEPTLPPRVVFLAPTTRGFLLVFNKPMNPAGASDVNNYSVKYASYGHVKSVQIQTAQYDPATQSVTLIPKNSYPNLNTAFTDLTLLQTARTSVRRGHRSNIAGSLTDLQGNPINAGTTPGTISLRYSNSPPRAASF